MAWPKMWWFCFKKEDRLLREFYMRTWASCAKSNVSFQWECINDATKIGLDLLVGARQNSIQTLLPSSWNLAT